MAVTVADPRVMFEVTNEYRFVLISLIVNIFLYISVLSTGGKARK